MVISLTRLPLATHYSKLISNIKISVLSLTKIILSVTIAVGFGCSSQGREQPGICLSFDDRNLEQWVEILPLLKKYDAKVTFFLNGVETLSPAEKSMIRQIQHEGHDIQSHGEHHLSMNSYIQDKGVFKYWQTEISRHLEAFEVIGITPTVFAYPFGEKNRYIDLFLWTKFSATRNVAAPKEELDKVDEIFYKMGEDRFNFFSLGIDESKKVSEHQLEKALQRACVNGEIVLVHAHEIGENGAYKISKERLEWLLENGKKSGLKFYRYSELIG